MRSVLAFAGFCLLARPVSGHGPAVPFTENRGQWPAHVLYRATIPGGVLFVERSALTYVLRQGGPLADHAHGREHRSEPLRMHAYRVTFEGARVGTPEGEFRQPHYENHFIGADPARWGAGCGVFGEVWVKGIYPGIDLRIDGRVGLKYDLVVAPGADPSMIRMRYEGHDRLELLDRRLHVVTTAGTVVEEAPIAFHGVPVRDRNSTGDPEQRVACAYALDDGVVSFTVKHDRSSQLVIDPSLTFATYTGSTADNFGFTATYDLNGFLYGGGIVFDIGYPTTPGVLDASFNGGSIDMGITKFSLDGTALVWSTYLGGALGNETPQSLVANANGELFVLATTGSSDFPTTPGCFDPTFNGGVAIPLVGGFANLLGGEGYDFASGTDIVVAHLSADATALIGSTYVGGSGNDGLNNSFQLAYNYGDHFRGEIALDGAENPVIASSTQSADAPVPAGAPQPAFGGGAQDGYLFRMDPGLTAQLFATFRGGSQDDSGFGVQFASNGEIFLSGGTASADLPMAGTPFDNTYDGAVDGYLARYSAAGNALLSATFLGTPAEDQCYFVQLNTSDEVFVVGQTHGAYPVTPGKYNNPNSSQFIQKLDQGLATSLWSTRIGSGLGNEDIAPSAFLVSDCGQIYFSGWGGTVNWNVLATNSTTAGLPLTADAFQPATDGNDFYLMVLEPEATALHYATYFGGNLSSEHVDGGTSRFDKDGNVYQAVCAGCWANNDFPTTPGAWSPTNNTSFGCNLGVFKMALTEPVAVIDIAGPGYVCQPGTADFINLSVGGNNYWWDFGDGNTSTAFEPSHAWPDTGTYVVTMILSDSSACTPNDTAYLNVTVLDGADASIDPPDPLCEGDSIQLHAHGGTDYAWFPNNALSDTTIADPWASPDSATTYFVIVSDSCGSDTASVFVDFFIPFGQAGPDTVVCLGDSVPITALGGGSYLWSPAAGLSDPAIQTPMASPADTTQYAVQITTPDGCIVHDTLTVLVQFGDPVPVTNDTMVCEGGSVQIQVSGGDQYLWDPAPGITDLTVPDPVVSPPAPMHYMVTVSNACASVLDSVFVDVIVVVADAWPDTVICPGESVVLIASGGTGYDWSPGATLSDPDSSITTATPAAATTYQVTVSDAFGCEDVASVTVDLFPEPWVYAGQDFAIEYGEQAQLGAQSGPGALLWTPDLWITCTDCPSPVVFPEVSTLYTVEITDANGCRATDDVFVIINGTLYVPNTFTPDGDGVNDTFFALATEVKEFRMYVFNRWGEKIYEAADLDDPWDGTYSGTPSPIDTYVWRVDMQELNGEKHVVFGHVNLVR